MGLLDGFKSNLVYVVIVSSLFIIIIIFFIIIIIIIIRIFDHSLICSNVIPSYSPLLELMVCETQYYESSDSGMPQRKQKPLVVVIFKWFGYDPFMLFWPNVPYWTAFNLRGIESSWAFIPVLTIIVNIFK